MDFAIPSAPSFDCLETSDPMFDFTELLHHVQEQTPSEYWGSMHKYIIYRSLINDKL